MELDAIQINLVHNLSDYSVTTYVSYTVHVSLLYSLKVFHTGTHYLLIFDPILGAMETIHLQKKSYDIMHRATEASACTGMPLIILCSYVVIFVAVCTSSITIYCILMQLFR